MAYVQLYCLKDPSMLLTLLTMTVQMILCLLARNSMMWSGLMPLEDYLPVDVL